MIEIHDLRKTYQRGATAVTALRGVSLTVPDGEFLSIMGPSGSGKSTLLNVLGALDQPSSGSIRIGGQEISRMSDRELSIFRRDRIGFVFQFFNLLPTLSAIENVMLPALLAGNGTRETQSRAEALLERVGLSRRAHHRPDELSGGEMQRTAVARALITNPALVLADEPTGTRDSASGRELRRLIRATSREQNVTVVMVTHDPNAPSIGDRIVRLADGVIVGDERIAAQVAA